MLTPTSSYFLCLHLHFLSTSSTMVKSLKITLMILCAILTVYILICIIFELWSSSAEALHTFMSELPCPPLILILVNFHNIGFPRPVRASLPINFMGWRSVLGLTMLALALPLTFRNLLTINIKKLCLSPVWAVIEGPHAISHDLLLLFLTLSPLLARFVLSFVIPSPLARFLLLLGILMLTWFPLLFFIPIWLNSTASIRSLLSWLNFYILKNHREFDLRVYLRGDVFMQHIVF